MFANIFFLILTLLTITLSPRGSSAFLSPFNAWLSSMGLYLGLLILIYFQIILFPNFFRKKKNLGLAIINIELLIFLMAYHFVLQGDQLFFSFSNFATTLQTAFSIVLYFLGLTFYYFLIERQRKILPKHPPLKHALLQVAFLLPFVFPFLLLTFLFDLINKYKWLDLEKIQEMSTLTDTLIFLGLNLGFMALMVVFLPPLIQWIWQCKVLPPSPLQEKLVEICKRAGFKNPKLKTWTVLNHSLTAAIVGVVPPFRYILFTQKLLDEISPESIEAVLAHEIGHSYRKHLLIYPFILLGFMALTGLLALFFSNALEESLILLTQLYPSSLWNILIPFFIFIVYGGLIIGYFRLVFGFFSRLFERQADLHVFALSIPPAHMIKALDELGYATGNTHHHPSWHHYSIQQRIDYLNKVTEAPDNVQQHHRTVKNYLTLYFLALGVAALLLLSPWLPTTPVFKQIFKSEEFLASKIDWNHSLRHTLADQYIDQYGLEGNRAQIQSILDRTFHQFSLYIAPQELNLIAAQRLDQANETQASLALLTHIWQTLSPQDLTPKFSTALVQFTDFLLKKNTPSTNPLVESLQQVYKNKITTFKAQP